MSATAKMSFEQYKQYRSFDYRGHGVGNSKVNNKLINISNQRLERRLSSAKPPLSRKQMRSSKRLWVVAALVVATLIVLLPAAEAFGGNPLVSSERQSADSQNVITFTVRPGDTLWSIAKEIEPNKDPRETVDKISKIRGTATLNVGEKIIWQK